MSDDGLFEGLADQVAPKRAGDGGAARVSTPQRAEPSWEMLDLNALIGPEHPARQVWSFVGGLDLGALYAAIQVRTHTTGRPAIDPALLMALWLYATIDGVGSAREIERLCASEHAYRWLCGGVGVNHHALSDFRTAHEALLDRLLTDSVTALASDGLITLERLAQDGVKVRASAGAASFRRRGRLESLRAEAGARVRRLKAELDGAAAASQRRKLQARERAAAEREERCRKALVRLRDLELEQERRAKRDRERAGKKKEVRASTTDPEARVMKMADGGYRPAYNVQIAGEPGSQVIVGVAVETSGSDFGQVRPMLEQIQTRYGHRPAFHLADAGFCQHADIEWAAAQGTLALIPASHVRDGQKAYAPQRGDGPGLAAWRRIMPTPAAQLVYAARGRIECLMAQMRQRGLRQFLVRGSAKVRCVVLWHALAHNLLCAARLRVQAA